MAVSREEVLRVAHLARLELSPEEVEQFTEQLNGILRHVETLAEVDVSAVEAVGRATDWSAPLRAETASPDPLMRPVESMAPAWRDGFFTVPRLAALDVVEIEDALEDKARVPSEGRPSPESLKGGES
jgi:aspartyl-tRNA(Asn)/glutamyl-tRNA(Gln) amidotransferase subunit C